MLDDVRTDLLIWWELEVRDRLPMWLVVGAMFAAVPLVIWTIETGGDTGDWFLAILSNPSGLFWSLRIAQPLLAGPPAAQIDPRPWTPPDSHQDG